MDGSGRLDVDITIDLVLSFFAQAFSRKNEFEADTFARETTGMSEHLITALKHLAAEHGPTPQQVETPLADIPRDSGCYLFQNALRAEAV